ncbi:hypothetical protein B565_0335 [Aeromonas veronii B565]|nr:hypothetical protein B565_0335 [Aeromonas veronii B565]
MIATRGNPVQNPAYRPTPTSFRRAPRFIAGLFFMHEKIWLRWQDILGLVILNEIICFKSIE